MNKSSKDVLEACDPRLMRGVLDDMCAVKQIDVGSPEADLIAHQLLELWHGGVRSVDDFKSIIKSLNKQLSD